MMSNQKSPFILPADANVLRRRVRQDAAECSGRDFDEDGGESGAAAEVAAIDSSCA